VTDAPSLLDVADQLAVRDLIAAFADAVNRMAPDEVGDLFTADGEWVVSGWGAPQGRGDIVSFLAGLLERWEVFIHVVHTGRVWLDGRKATGRWYITEFGRLTDGTEVKFAGVYHDDYVRTGDGWQFARRRYDSMFRRRGGELSVSPFPSL
jgi:hypothetical protein